MERLTESAIEAFAIKLFERLGYSYVYAPVMELKNAVDENATIKSAWQQIETYKQAIPCLFSYNALLVISDGLEAKAGSLSAGLSRFMAWKSADGVGTGLVPALSDG